MNEVMRQYQAKSLYLTSKKRIFVKIRDKDTGEEETVPVIKRAMIVICPPAENSGVYKASVFKRDGQYRYCISVLLEATKHAMFRDGPDEDEGKWKRLETLDRVAFRRWLGIRIGPHHVEDAIHQLFA